MPKSKQVASGKKVSGKKIDKQRKKIEEIHK